MVYFLLIKNNILFLEFFFFYIYIENYNANVKFIKYIIFLI